METGMGQDKEKEYCDIDALRDEITSLRKRNGELNAKLGSLRDYIRNITDDIFSKEVAKSA